MFRKFHTYQEQTPGNGGGGLTIAEVASAMKSALDPLSAKIAALEEKAAQPAPREKATNNLGGTPGAQPVEPARAPITGKHAADGTGIHFARAVKALACEKLSGGRTSAEAHLKSWGYHEVAKVFAEGIAAQKAAPSATSNRYESMGIFVETSFSQEMFELLRPKVWIREQAREVPLINSLGFKRQSSTSTSAYEGESSPIQNSKTPDLGEEFMQEKKLTTLVSFANRLLQTASSSAESFVRDDILASKARKENDAFYRGKGTNKTPKGIRTRALAANVFKGAQAGATPTLAEVRAVRSKLMQKLADANAPMGKLRWIMSPRVKFFLEQITDGNGNAVYETQMSAGNWGGLAFDMSTTVPNDVTDSGDNNLSELGLVDYSEVIIGQGDMFMETFPNATYEADGAVRSGINRDESVIRLIDYHDLITRHAESFAFANVKWGL